MKKLILLCGLMSLAACTPAPTPTPAPANTTCSEATGDCNLTYSDGAAK